jgi:hypothetical protein
MGWPGACPRADNTGGPSLAWQWLFSSRVKQDVVILSGHSLWFKSYFNEYLPNDFKVALHRSGAAQPGSLTLRPLFALVQHDAKKKKMRNGAIVCFDVDCYRTADGKVRCSPAWRPQRRAVGSGVAHLLVALSPAVPRSLVCRSFQTAVQIQPDSLREVFLGFK